LEACLIKVGKIKYLTRGFGCTLKAKGSLILGIKGRFKKEALTLFWQRANLPRGSNKRFLFQGKKIKWV